VRLFERAPKRLDLARAIIVFEAGVVQWQNVSFEKTVYDALRYIFFEIN